MPSAIGNRRAYLPQLDGARGVAVLLIVAFHRFGRVLPGGYIGVDIFFVLSGYLITWILVSQIAVDNALNFALFYWRRATRLLPALIVVSAATLLAIFLIPSLAQRGSTLRGIIGALTYTSSPLAASGVDLGAFLPTWSLSVEEYFYFVWPLALVWLFRRNESRLWQMLIAITSLSAAYTVAISLSSDSVRRLAYAPDTRTVQLLIGCTLAVLVGKRRFRAHASLAAVSTAVLMLFVVLPATVGDAIYFRGGCVVVAILAGIVLTHLVTSGDSPISWLLRRKPIVWIGQRSYGIYLWNLPIVLMVSAFRLPGSASLIIKLGLSLTIPAISFRFIERPILRWGARHPLQESGLRRAVVTNE